MSVRLEIYDDIALLVINNPPVNALSASVRQGLVRAIKSANQNPDIKGVIIKSEGKIFIGGADIKEFGKPPIEPFLPDVIDIIENARMPTLALIQGAALGGGLELALGCRYRIGGKNALCGLPEVNLGLIPGAGGTQRLPRLIGAFEAAEMISTGKPLPAQKALQAGVLDAVFADNLLENAIEFLRAKINSAAPRPALSEIEIDDWHEEKLEKLLAKTKAHSRGQLSPVKALQAVMAAKKPFTQGVKIEREIFNELMESDQRAGLVHVFFGQRNIAKPAELKNTKPAKIKNINILGAGTMGIGIAQAALAGGYNVGLFDVNENTLKTAFDKIFQNLKTAVQKDKIDKIQMREMLARLNPLFDIKTAAKADLVIEAVVENMQVKKSVFKDLEHHAPPSTIFASNTSYLDINELAKTTKRAGQVLGLHFFSPAHIMKLLEIIRADKTSKQSLATALAAGKKMGKIPVISGVCDGFIGNRMLKAYRRQAEYIMMDGAMPWQIDEAMRGFGFAMGPFEVSDLAGLDIGYFNRRREDKYRPQNERYIDIADKLYEMGRLGQKTGAGYYKYKNGRTPIIDNIVEDLIIKQAKKEGINRREFSDNEISQRLVLALINEGANILDEKIAQRALDIDMVWVFGYGFPKYRGGPMFYADTLGLSNIKSMIDGFAKQDNSWKLSPLIERLVKENKSFADYSS